MGSREIMMRERVFVNCKQAYIVWPAFWSNHTAKGCQKTSRHRNPTLWPGSPEPPSRRFCRAPSLRLHCAIQYQFRATLESFLNSLSGSPFPKTSHHNHALLRREHSRPRNGRLPQTEVKRRPLDTRNDQNALEKLEDGRTRDLRTCWTWQALSDNSEWYCISSPKRKEIAK